MDLKQCDYCKKVENTDMAGCWGKIIFKDYQRIIDGQSDEILFDVCPDCLKKIYWHMYSGAQTGKASQ